MLVESVDADRDNLTIMVRRHLEFLADLEGPRFQVFTLPSSANLAGSPLHNPFGRLKLLNVRDIGEVN